MSKQNKTKTKQNKNKKKQKSMFTCGCNQTFTRNDSLVRHQRTCYFGPLLVNPTKKKRLQLINDDERYISESNFEHDSNNSNIDCDSNSDNVSDNNSDSDSENNGDSDSDNSDSDNNEINSNGENIEEDEELQRSDILHFQKPDNRYFPFPTREASLIYMVANMHPKLSKRKFQKLLQVLHAPGFEIANVPKTVYFFSKIEENLPTLPIGIYYCDFSFFLDLYINYIWVLLLLICFVLFCFLFCFLFLFFVLFLFFCLVFCFVFGFIF